VISLFFDVRTLVVLFLLLTSALLAVLGFGAPLAVVAQVNRPNQPVVPIVAREGDRIDSEDRIEKSCTYLSRATETLGANKVSELGTSNLPTTCFPVESTVQRTFNGHIHTLHAFSGKYVQWEIPDSWTGPTALDSGEIRQLVDITDMLYADYAELVQGEPSGSGLLTISVNPEDPATAGVGCLGCKGVTLTAGWVPVLKRDLQIRVPNGIIVHEMGHNFDIYHDYLEYYNDGVHAWTTVVQYYLPYYMRVGDFLGGPDDALERWFRKITVPWDALGSGASWSACVRNGGGCEANGVIANDGWGGLVLRFARLHGTSALRRVFDYLSDYKAAHPTPPGTPEAKNDLLVMALAAGARLNIACELDAWHWEFSQAVRTQLAQNYPGQDAFCLDADGDRFSRARGDLNDHNASTHPGANEVTNGIDDDCDGVVDDVLVMEQNDFPSDVFQAPTIGSIPLRITGHASAVDQDAVRVRMGTSLHLKARVRSFGGLQGEFDIGSITGGGAGYGVGSFAPNSVTNFDADIPVGADGILVVKPANGSAGNYEIILDGTPSRPPDPVRLATSAGANTGSVRIAASINLAPINGERPTSIRFWANGIGSIQALPVSQSISFEWMPPAGYCGNGISAQLIAGDHPISVATPALQTLANISTRSFVQTGDNVMIGGFIVQGTQLKRVIVRAIGPDLSQYGVPNVLADPILELHDGTGALIASNDNWLHTILGGIIASDQMRDIRNSGHAPGDPRESAIIADLPPGNYTAIVRGGTNTTGVALVEVYDLSSDIASVLGNISTRSFVQTDANVMIGGFIIQGAGSKKVIVRAIGPDLGAPPYNIPNTLADPTLELHDGTGALIASNDNWQHTIIGGIITAGQVSAIQSSGKAPGNANESAIIATLPPGNYTAIVHGSNNTTGVALVEVYDLN